VIWRKSELKRVMDGHTQLNDYTSIYIEWKITSTAWGWRIFLKVLEFLQDPLGGHGKREQDIPFDQVAERERVGLDYWISYSIKNKIKIGLDYWIWILCFTNSLHLICYSIKNKIKIKIGLDMFCSKRIINYFFHKI
jgi:hypothetical protein